jgi:hypothetical protein
MTLHILLMYYLCAVRFYLVSRNHLKSKFELKPNEFANCGNISKIRKGFILPISFEPNPCLSLVGLAPSCSNLGPLEPTKAKASTRDPNPGGLTRQHRVNPGVT